MASFLLSSKSATVALHHDRCANTRSHQTSRISVNRSRVQRLVCQATEDPKTGNVSLRITQPVPFKTYFKVCGSTEELGAWKLDDAPAMEWSEGDVWSLTIKKPVGEEVEYKLVKIPRREPIKWESGKNRSLVVPQEDVTFDLVFDKMEAQAVVPKVEAAASADVAATVEAVETEIEVAAPPQVADPEPLVQAVAPPKVAAPAQAAEPELEAVPTPEVAAAAQEAVVQAAPAVEAEEESKEVNSTADVQETARMFQEVPRPAPPAEEEEGEKALPVEQEVVALAAEEEGLLLSAIASEVVESADMLPILDHLEDTEEAEEPSASMNGAAGTPVVAATSVEDSQGGPLGFLGRLNPFGKKN